MAWVGKSPSVVRLFNGNPRFEGWYGRRPGHRTGDPGRMQRAQEWQSHRPQTPKQHSEFSHETTLLERLHITPVGAQYLSYSSPRQPVRCGGCGSSDPWQRGTEETNSLTLSQALLYRTRLRTWRPSRRLRAAPGSASRLDMGRDWESIGS